LAEQGGVARHKINFISLDDGYSPPKTVEDVHRLVEEDQVAFLFNTLGTPTSSAIVRYVNQKKAPHLFRSEHRQPDHHAGDRRRRAGGGGSAEVRRAGDPQAVPKTPSRYIACASLRMATVADHAVKRIGLLIAVAELFLETILVCPSSEVGTQPGGDHEPGPRHQAHGTQSCTRA
jgi:hypothetical protein